MTSFVLMITVFPAFVLAVVFGVFFAHRGPSWTKSLIKTASVALLALAAVLTLSPAALIAGLAFGALGDLALSRRGDPAFLTGLVSFAIAHLFYIALIMQSGQAGANRVLLALLVGFSLVMAAVLWPRTGALRWPVMAYIAIIFAMGWVALHLPVTHAFGRWAALCFIASDALLACDLFILPAGHRAKRIIAPLLWTLYWAAQVLFLFAFWGAFPH